MAQALVRALALELLGGLQARLLLRALARLQWPPAVLPQAADSLRAGLTTTGNRLRQETASTRCLKSP